MNRYSDSVLSDEQHPRSPVLRASHLSKEYPSVDGKGPSVVLFRDLNLQVRPGEMIAIIGRSGAGKSSLLHLLAGLDRPSGGEVWIAEQPLHSLPEAQLSEVRNRHIGYVWQFHYLLPEFSAVENVAMPLLARGLGRRAAVSLAHTWLDRVGLGSRDRHRTGELSGGEQQRVAIARALVTTPSVLLADEPTGDLDDDTAKALFALVAGLCRAEHLATVLVTHNQEIARRCDRQLLLTEGHLQAALLGNAVGR